MPAPYLNADEIEGLVATFPLYTYFPESEWKHIRRAEIADEEGLRIRHKYAEIYKSEFLGETQDERKKVSIVGGTGCNASPRETYRFSVDRLSPEEIDMLTTTASY